MSKLAVGVRFARAGRPFRVGLMSGVVAMLVVLPLLSACSDGTPSTVPNPEATGTVKGHGVVVTVRITPEMLNSKPATPTLTSPEAAVRSYLDWISYAYRIGDSDVAKPAMSVLEEVRVNSYVQFNLQEHNRVIDQNLQSITFGTSVSKDASTTVISAKEKWTYKWVSAKNAGEVIGGPFTTQYDTTYTVIQYEPGTWLVDKVEAVQVGKD